MQSDRMGNRKYVSWVKAGTALQYVKEGISTFTDTHAQKLHAKIREKVESASADAVTKTCKSCTCNHISKSRDRSKWILKCPNNVCNHWLSAILGYHAGSVCPIVFWKNVDPRLWPSTPWEVAKTFKPRGCTDHQSSKDSDCKALLDLMLNCSYFHQFYYSKQVLFDIREHRNKIMHGGSLEVEDSDLVTWTDNMIKLLTDPVHLASLPECQEAARKIEELRNNDLEMALGKQLEIARLTQLTNGLNDDIKQLQTDMEEVRSSQVNQEDITEIEGKMTEVKEQVQKLLALCSQNAVIVEERDGVATRNENEELKLKLQDLERQCVVDIRNEIQATKADIQEVKKSGQRQTVEIVNIQKIQEQHNRDVNQLSEQLDEVKLLVQGKTNENTDTSELETLYARQDQETSDIKRARADLIINYRENYSHCRLHPLNPKYTEKLLNTYVKPKMRVNSRAASFKDIFNVSSESCKNIYIVGESGVGKSTLCDYMVHAWCCAHLERGDNLVDEETMKRFPLLFYISLRHSTPNQTIEDMINDQLIHKDNDIDKLLSDDCLIVLDGLDEWRAGKNEQAVLLRRNRGLPRLKSKCKCTIVTTSRPWKLECLRLSERDIDRQIFITGLDLPSTETLARNMTKELIRTYQPKEKDSRDFIEKMKSRGLDHFMKTPVMLKQMVCLWFDDVPLGKSQCEIYTNLIERQLQMAIQEDKANVFSSDISISRDCAQLPIALRNGPYPKVEEYQNVLMSLAKLAFNTLINADRESALVFDHHVTSMHGMLATDVELCLRIGLLSQQELHGKITECKKTLNFIHKSYHEYFAALHLAAHGDTISRIKEVCTTHEMLREIEEIPRFLCMMSPAVCRDLVSYLRSVVSKDSGFVSYRRNEEEWVDRSSRILKNVQSAILDLTTELEHSGNHENYSLPINDLIVDSDNIAFVESKLQTLDVRDMESITVTVSPDTDTELHAHFDSLLKTVSQSKSLSKVCLDDMTKTVSDNANPCLLNAEHVKEIITNCQESLKSLQLTGVDFISLPRVSSIRRMIRSDPFALMLKTLSVVSLNMKHIKLRDDQLKVLVNFLYKTDNLRELCLREVPIGETGCGYSVDLGKHGQLEYLYLRDLHFKTFKINTSSLKVCDFEELHTAGCAKSILSCLKEAQQLERVECASVDQKEDVDALVKDLPCLECVQSISIRHVDFEERAVLLSRKMRNLKKVRFFKVQMNTVVLKGLLDKLPQHSLTVDLDMFKLSSADGVSNLVHQIQSSQWYSVDKMYKDRKGHWRMLFGKKEDIGRSSQGE